jgi:hypothetical protein
MARCRENPDARQRPAKLREVEKIWLDTGQLCEYLSICESQSYQLRKQGLPYCKVGKLVRYDKREVDRFIKRREVRERSMDETLSELRVK